MADLHLRLHKDMLIMSSSFDYALESQDFVDDADKVYAALCEPEIIEEQLKLEATINIPCFLPPTENITNARLAYASFEGRGEDLAENAFEILEGMPIQHIIAPIYSAGLPIDETSKTSLKQSRKQYQDAVQILKKHPIDAIYFEDFKNAYDAQCALMGARAVYDGVLMISFRLNNKGEFEQPNYSFEKAVQMAEEYGADVIGIVSDASISTLVPAINAIKELTNAAILVELVCDKSSAKAINPAEANPYFAAQTMIDAAVALCALGVQFIRPAGKVTPSYSGALLATVIGQDVVPS